MPDATLKLFRHPPKFNYNGLTVVMSNPSRNDEDKLLTGNGGTFFAECLQPHTTRFHCDIRLALDKTPLLPNTRAILLLGESAMHSWIPERVDSSLGELRGSPIIQRDTGIVQIASYSPQDSQDIVNHEAKLNPHLLEKELEDEKEGKEEDEKKRHGKTSRKNFAFWLKKDIDKTLRIIQNGGKLPKEDIEEPEYIICPSLDVVVKLLLTTKKQFLYFDLETDFSRNILCIGFAFDLKRIYVVPILRYNYTLAYTKFASFLRAFAISLRDNTAVAHNGAGFDFIVLAWKYRIAIGKSVFDTMIGQHRCYMQVERSLGHCTSLWTYEIFHKDEGIMCPQNSMAEEKLWKYCGKDVSTMIRIHRAMIRHAAVNKGVQTSFDQGMASIRPYLIAELTGIRYRQSVLEEKMKHNDRMMMQYLRMLKVCVGEDTLKKIRSKSDKSMPLSNKQCVNYFHKLLGYKIVKRGKTRKDGTRGPSLDEKAMLKLRLKYENPVIDICLAYRRLAKASGSLKFTPFKQ